MMQEASKNSPQSLPRECGPADRLSSDSGLQSCEIINFGGGRGVGSGSKPQNVW